VFVPGKPVQPSPMFVGKARGLPKSGAPGRNKYTSLLQKSLNHGRKKFYSTGPGVENSALITFRLTYKLKYVLCNYAHETFLQFDFSLSNSILIYAQLQTGLYTQLSWRETASFKTVIKLGELIK
jgi:hypothetical protein